MKEGRKKDERKLRAQQEILDDEAGQFGFIDGDSYSSAEGSL